MEVHESLTMALQCGLDRSKRAGEVSIEEQADVMIEQVKLAKELGRPLSVCNSTSQAINSQSAS